MVYFTFLPPVACVRPKVYFCNWLCRGRHLYNFADGLPDEASETYHWRL